MSSNETSGEVEMENASKTGRNGTRNKTQRKIPRFSDVGQITGTRMGSSFAD